MQTRQDPPHNGMRVHNGGKTQEMSYTKQEIDLIKDSVCRGASDEEFKVFIHACKHTKLDPLMKQIYSIPRWDSKLRREARTVQVSIDGLRLIAERTGKYMPGPKATFEYDEQGNLFKATAYVKRLDSMGVWHTIEGEAFYKEYVQTTKDGDPSGLWKTKEHVLLAKCAESQGLRRAFPADMSQIHSHEEMGTIDVEAAVPQTLRPQQLDQIERLLDLVPDVRERMLAAYNVKALHDIKAGQFDNIHDRLQQMVDQRRAEGKINNHPSVEEISSFDDDELTEH